MHSSPKGLEYFADYSATYVSRSLVDKEYVDDYVAASSSADNISNVDLTQTDLNRVYTRSPIAGVSRLRLQGASQILTLEDSTELQIFSGKYDDAGAVPRMELSGNQINFNGQASMIQGINSELFIYGQFNTTLQTKIQLGADLKLNSKSNRYTVFNADQLRWANSADNTGYGQILNGVFCWGGGSGNTATQIGSEGFSVQKDTLVKGSDNSVNTSGFKVTDINDNSLLEVKNSGRFATNGSNVNSAFNVAYDGTSNNSFTVSSGNTILSSINSQNFAIFNSAGTQDLLRFRVQSGVTKLVLSTTSGVDFLNLQTGTDGYYARKININSATASNTHAVIQLNQGSANVSQQLFFANITTTTLGRNGSIAGWGATEKGFECFDTTTNKKHVWNGTAWEQIISNTTGIIPSLNISNTDLT